MTIVDIHPHIVSHDTARYPITPIGGKRSDWSHERSVELDELVAAMKTAGVDKAAVVHSSTTYGFACDYLADSVAKHPGRLTGVFSVNVLEPGAPEAMKHWYAKGLTGMRIFSRGSTLDGALMSIADERIFPCYELAAEMKIAMATNVTIDLFSQLETVLKQFPKVNFVVDHMGSADFSEGAPFAKSKALFDLAKYPNLHLKVTSNNFRKAGDHSASLFKQVVGAYGADRLAWGSNYPSAKGTLAEILAMARNGLSSLSSSDQDWILGKTAQKLYPALA